MKVLITGSNGLLGQKLVKLFVEKGGYEVYASSRGKDRLSVSNAYKYVQMDVTNADEVDLVFDKLKPNVLIHTAAMTNVDQCEREPENCWLQNVEAVKYLISAATRHHTFFLHLSTDFIFDGLAGPYREDDKAKPVSVYGESKLASEELLKKSILKWAIARTVLVFGIAQDMSRSNIILWVKNSLKQGKQIQVVNDQWRTPTLAEDLAEGCFLIVQRQAEGIYNISGKDMLSPYDMAIATADYFELDKSLICETDGSRFRQDAKRPPKTGFILDKAYQMLDYNPHSFREGLEVLAGQLAEYNIKASE